ncbi:unnamed protein product [Spirodela intermedia]|uniref:Uncharacterized protein n=2 Tax=Spirodela intermedia TaxID=51605 RepID=A0A7I8IMP5_SPIIN|nr:unnamed protein product [Spirodela intermedia]CAA6659215.1 unnamed protein product [Spirodela intermedia]CAA6674675.1 unnamed protein product [Spirodela intermedia]CAA7395528.1 unnamed protein product [Spirodela intermedia]
MASTKVELLQLDKKTNFTLWQVKMKAVLMQLDLEDALFPTIPASWTEDHKKMVNQKALTQIQLHLTNDIIRDVQKETKAHKLWSRLDEICMVKIVTRRNLDLCSLLLMSLPSSFSGFWDILFYGSKGLSLESIYEALSSKEIICKFSKMTTLSQAEGLVIRRRDLER